jgi:hypothetical protein
LELRIPTLSALVAACRACPGLSSTVDPALAAAVTDDADELGLVLKLSDSLLGFGIPLNLDAASVALNGEFVWLQNLALSVMSRAIRQGWAIPLDFGLHARALSLLSGGGFTRQLEATHFLCRSVIGAFEPVAVLRHGAFDRFIAEDDQVELVAMVHDAVLESAMRVLSADLADHESYEEVVGTVMAGALVLLQEDEKVEFDDSLTGGSRCRRRRRRGWTSSRSRCSRGSRVSDRRGHAVGTVC